MLLRKHWSLRISIVLTLLTYIVESYEVSNTFAFSKRANYQFKSCKINRRELENGLKRLPSTFMSLRIAMDAKHLSILCAAFGMMLKPLSSSAAWSSRRHVEDDIRVNSIESINRPVAEDEKRHFSFWLPDSPLPVIVLSRSEKIRAAAAATGVVLVGGLAYSRRRGLVPVKNDGLAGRDAAVHGNGVMAMQVNETIRSEEGTEHVGETNHQQEDTARAGESARAQDSAPHEVWVEETVQIDATSPEALGKDDKHDLAPNLEDSRRESLKDRDGEVGGAEKASS
jgi:hypothetical protein